MIARNRQGGTALLVALFLITVVAALGLFAVRMGVHQEQTTSVQVLKARAHYAAQAGMEILAHRISNAPAGGCPGVGSTLNLTNNYNGLRNHIVEVTSCTRITSGTMAAVYEITVTARSSSGAFGSAGYVRQSVSRTISSIGAGSY